MRQRQVHVQIHSLGKLCAWARMSLVLLLAIIVSACANASANAGKKLTISTQGNQLLFTQSELQVSAGDKVLLTFTNDPAALQHNWVLVKGGDAVAQQVSDAVLAAGLENGLLPADQSAILAHSPLLDSGAQATITFTAPTVPGTYTYLCTFPGHYIVGMKGTLLVEP